MSIHVVTLQH